MRRETLTDVLLVGEAMGLFIAEEYGSFEEVQHFTKGIAGAEMNVSIGLSRLGFDVSYVSKLGKDPMGCYIKEFLENEKVNTEQIIIDEKINTGLQIKNKVSEDDPKVYYYRKDSAFSTLHKGELDAIDFTNVRLFHITGIPLAINERTREVMYELTKKAKAANCIITFDPNLRLTLWEDAETMASVINDIAQYADVFMPGLGEGTLLTGYTDANQIADFYHNLGVKTVIIKNGSDGAYFKEKGQKMELVPGVKVETVVDTVGAGDGFAAGVISGLLEELSIEDSVKRGNAVGAIQVQHKSDNEGLPTRDELLTYTD